MSRDARDWAWQQLGGLDAAPALVLLAIADKYNDDDRCAWPSLDTLARMTGRDRRTVRRSLVTLEGRGLLTTTAARGRRSTRYHLPIERSGGVVSIERGRGAPVEGARRPPNRREPLVNLPPTPQPGLSARAEQIARRAGELHEQAAPIVHTPGALARWRANELRTIDAELLEQLARVADLELDVLARSALDGRLPSDPPDPRGRFLPGTGWVPDRPAAS